MTLFLGQIVLTRETPEGREAVVSVRGARRVIVLDAVPRARVGDTVLVEAGTAVALVRDVERASIGEEGSACA
jgi:hydrogenase maturation factor